MTRPDSVYYYMLNFEPHPDSDSGLDPYNRGQFLPDQAAQILVLAGILSPDDLFGVQSDHIGGQRLSGFTYDGSQLSDPANCVSLRQVVEQTLGSLGFQPSAERIFQAAEIFRSTDILRPPLLPGSITIAGDGTLLPHGAIEILQSTDQHLHDPWGIFSGDDARSTYGSISQ